MKIISYVLYGKNKLYNNGALLNCQMAKTHYPDFEVWIYISHPDDIDGDIYCKLCGMDNVKIINMNDINLSVGKTIWRYIPVFNEDAIEFFITRDLDSALDNGRDLFAVKQWIESDCKYHIIRDHPAHAKVHIMGGIFGIKGNELCKYKDIFNKFVNDCKKNGNYRNDIMSEKAFKHLCNDSRQGLSIDQTFLKLFLYEKILNETLIHFSSNSIKNYPNKKFEKNDTDKCKKFEVIPNDIICKYVGSKENF